MSSVAPNGCAGMSSGVLGHFPLLIRTLDVAAADRALIFGDNGLAVSPI
jgi:hypothetical protein